MRKFKDGDKVRVTSVPASLAMPLRVGARGTVKPIEHKESEIFAHERDLYMVEFTSGAAMVGLTAWMHKDNLEADTGQAEPVKQWAPLHQIAAGLPVPDDKGPRPNTYGIAQLMTLVAADVASLDRTGRTLDMVMEDAYKVIRYVFDGGRL